MPGGLQISAHLIHPLELELMETSMFVSVFVSGSVMHQTRTDFLQDISIPVQEGKHAKKTTPQEGDANAPAAPTTTQDADDSDDEGNTHYGFVYIGTHDIKLCRVPTRTREMGKHFEQTGKVRENDTKYCKIQGISDKILEKSGIVICYSLVIFKHFKKNTGNGEKILGILSVRRNRNHDIYINKNAFQ